MPQLNLTVAAVAAIKPATDRVDYWDTHVSGFGVRVTSTGVKTWFGALPRPRPRQRFSIG
jgi:hypothetical protein